MENKLNPSALQKYSKDYAGAFFVKFNQKAFSGSDIKNLAQAEQINLQIIALLFDRWQKEREHLTSPYFDYQPKAVQDQMDTLMNVLSRHILVKPTDLRPLLEEAVQNTLELIFDPFAWWKKKMEQQKEVSTERTEKWMKFVKINTSLPQTWLEKAGGKTLSNTEAITLLEQAWQSLEEELEDTLGHVKALSEVFAPDLDILYKGNKHDEAYKDQPKVYVQPTPTASASQKKIVHTLHDSISTDSRPTLADRHRRSKLDSLTKAFSINQRFMFQKELFGGEQQTFDEAIAELDQCSTYDEAENLLGRNYISRFHWDLDSEEAGEFLEILARRFEV
jgi:hypothetical protein